MSRLRGASRGGVRQPWWIFVVALCAVAVSGVVVLFVLTTDTGEDADPDDAPAATDSVDGVGDESDRETEEGPVAGPWTTWERVPEDHDVFGVGRERPMAGVASAGPGLVAVGYDSAREVAVVWVSEDGREWERIEHDEEVFGGEGTQLMNDVALGGPGVVAVGTAQGDAGVWVSPDGRDWNRVPQEGALTSEGRQDINAVVAGGPGLVAVGRDRHLESAAVWVSEDGLDWERIEHDEDVFGGPGPQVMADVVATDDLVVAVGDDRGTDGDGAVWVSLDGWTWERVDAEEVVGGTGAQFITGLAARAGDFVAVGHDFAVPSPAVWSSADGREWSRMVLDAPDLGGDASGLMNAVAASDDGFVAVGQDGSAPAVWVSDGDVWRRVEDQEPFHGPGERRMDDVALFDEALVIVGADEDAGQAAVWRAE